ncbi:putative E3 ubiquitin-protein ligase SINA-like 6 [Lolium perenne]|uniref:putative E3 ubiquitin-protein ligase SINA-like 6 n=1 Tax=Lolium perenne TaxID=4522 RepID=UPI003A997ABD
MQAGASEERNRGSRSAMEKGRDQSAKKPRLDLKALPSVPVKQEIVVRQAAGPIVAVEHVAVMKIDLQIDVPVLHCPICFGKLKPPVFQCMRGHAACHGCLAGGCGVCDGAAFDVPNTAMDGVVSSVRAICDYDGCGRFITYHEADDHKDACPHAPCSCTEPGCTFKAPPRALVEHLVAAHAMREHKLCYGKTSEIEVPVPEPARSLLTGAEEDDDVFLLTVGALGEVTFVSAVCIRAAACPWPRYTVRLWVNGPLPAEANRRTDTVLADIEATSSTKPGAVVLGDLTSYLTVPPRYLVGAGPAKVLSLNVRVGKTTF